MLKRKPPALALEVGAMGEILELPVLFLADKQEVCAPDEDYAGKDDHIQLYVG